MEAFQQLTIDFPGDTFTTLLNSVKFEDMSPGRKGAVLTTENDGSVALVRITSDYKTPMQLMFPVHLNIVAEVQRVSGATFNNAWIEVYDTYRTMKYHSDQALDLDPKSWICVCSWYSDGVTTRKLQIKSKDSSKETCIPLLHNSIVLFSVRNNSRYLHRIVKHSAHRNQWLGLTLRKSHTFVNYVDSLPYINGRLLRIATEEERVKFLKLRGAENRSTEFVYPQLDYTISTGDTLVPI